MGNPFKHASRPIALALSALALTMSAPAHAQFFYPMIIVPPSQSQAVIPPRPAPPARQTDDRGSQVPASRPDSTHCHYQGQTRVCE